MSTVAIEPDELLEQILEDQRTDALQEFRERNEIAIDTTQLIKSDGHQTARLNSGSLGTRTQYARLCYGRRFSLRRRRRCANFPRGRLNCPRALRRGAVMFH